MDGVICTPLKRIPGEAGDVLHALKASAPGYAGFGEVYLSEIHAGAIKPWRRHRLVTSNLVVPIGIVRFVVHNDNNPEKFEEIRLSSGDNYVRLTIAPNLWFAFQGIGSGTSLILSISNREHNPTESDKLPLDGLSYVW